MFMAHAHLRAWSHPGIHGTYRTTDLSHCKAPCASASPSSGIPRSKKEQIQDEALAVGVTLRNKERPGSARSA